MPRGINHPRFEVEDVSHDRRDESSQFSLVCRDSEAYYSVPSRKPLGGVQSQKPCDLAPKRDFFGYPPGRRMGEDRSELIPTDEILVMNLEHHIPPVSHCIWTLDWGLNLVAHAEITCHDPLGFTAANFVPRATTSVVAVAVLRVRQDSMSWRHLDR